jgi:hypothetical protein
VDFATVDMTPFVNVASLALMARCPTIFASSTVALTDVACVAFVVFATPF